MVEVLSSVASLSLLVPQPVLAQVTLGTGGPALMLGIALMVGGAGLYFVRNFRPQLARDQDIALAAVALLAGTIMIFQGWRFDPIQMFGAYLMAGLSGFFAFETLRLRGAATEQAKRSSGPIVDNERPVSRVYRAELDEPPVQDDRPSSRRIRGQRDYRASSSDEFESDRRDRPSLRGSSDRSSSSASRRRSSSSSSASEKRTSRPERNYWEEDINDRSSRNYWDDDEKGSNVSASGNYSRSGDYDSSGRSRRSRPSDDPSRRRPDSDNADYVDYQPLDYEDDWS